MNASNEVLLPSAAIARLPLWLTISGAIVFVGSVVLAARLIWEETVWTWERGPQMVGFSLAHGSDAFLLLFPVLLILWTVIVVIFTVRSLFQKRRIRPARWIALALAVVVFMAPDVPQGFWVRVFITRMAASPRASDLLMYAAAAGDVGAVRALVDHGVPVDAADHFDWQTGLHAAAGSGHMRTIRYLISKGANVNALDRAGDSPLEVATSNGHVAAAKLLEEHGAKRIRGDSAQRQKAINDQVKEEIERMDREHQNQSNKTQ